MHKMFGRAVVTGGIAAVGLALAAGPASASTSVDFSTLSADQQSSVTNMLNAQIPAGGVGGQTFKVKDTSGAACFGIYVGRVTYDSSGRITKIETATVEFYQPVLSCLV